MIRKTLFTGFSPNMTTDIRRIALRQLLCPWHWTSLRRGSANDTVIAWMESRFNAQALLLDSGRSAIAEALRALGVGEGHQVLVQAYTCAVVINAIKHVGALPVYVDIDDALCMDPDDARSKISSKTKAMIIQHTFGASAQIDSLLELAKTHAIRTIEDCALAFAVTDEQGVLLGTRGDIGIFSFGSDKCLSSVRGGALVTGNTTLYDTLHAQISALPHLSLHMIITHLLHPIIFAIAKPLYSFGAIGKGILYLSRRLRVTASVIYPAEKKGSLTPHTPAQMPNALAALLVPQLARIEEIQAHRRNVATVYHALLKSEFLQPHHGIATPVRFVVLIAHAAQLIEKAKKEGILLGDWYRTVIAPADVPASVTGYTPGECPQADDAATQSINLPTHLQISPQDAARIALFLNSHV